MKLDYSYINTTLGLRYLLFDTNDKDRIIAFAAYWQLELLSRSPNWCFDDTFDSAVRK